MSMINNHFWFECTFRIRHKGSKSFTHKHSFDNTCTFFRQEIQAFYEQEWGYTFYVHGVLGV